MASNNYNPYNYPYSQNSAQQYSEYQTARASNAISQSSRRYQSTPATSQATDYVSYNTQPYNSQGNAYGATQDSTWGSSYDRNRETSRAAEVSWNKSNNSYTASNATAVTQPGFATTIAATTSRYSNNTPTGHTHQAPKTHATSPAYGQSQIRPRSVSANRGQAATSRGLPSPAIAAGYPSQRASTTLNQQPQRPASPTQAQYSHNSQTPVTSARSATITAASQYNDYGSRQLPNLDATRNATAAASSSYAYGDIQAPSSVLQAPINNAAETYNQGAITVDPMAVYDPWPEYQRKQEALRAQKTANDVARAEEERIAEEARKEKERRRDEERRQQEEDEMSKQTSLNNSNQNKRKSQPPAGVEASLVTSTSGAEEGSTGGGMEAEIRALMAKMREYNSKDPVMLARIWEEERRAKAPKSPTVGTKPAPQAAPTVHATQANPPQNANQKKKVSAREVSTAATEQMARPANSAAIASNSSGGNTIWPPEKKATLATVAATYLNSLNPHLPIDPDRILLMLDGNPSYIGLCEQLENAGMKLDRAVFAKTLLTAVPDVNSSSRAKPTQGPSNSTASPRAPIARPALMKRDIGTRSTSVVNYASAAPSRAYPNFPESHTPVPVTSAPVAEMVPIKSELKRPANKEEAARKRDFSDLIDLTQADEDDLEPFPKKMNVSVVSSHAPTDSTPFDYADLDESSTTQFPVSARATPQPIVHQPGPPAPHARDLRHADIVDSIDHKKALRRNTYNIKTIARDVLLACGRHPETRQLNQHLEVLRTNLPQVQQDADLSTLRWDLIDPGKPPRGYFKDNTQALAEGADNEEDSDEEEERKRPGSSLQLSDSTSQKKAQAPPLTEAINPFKQKHRRGRPPRNSFGLDQTTSVITPSSPTHPAPKPMSASAPRASSGGVGYAAFRSATQYDANGNPLPRKRGRPVGWRKNIHGSAQAQTIPSGDGYTSPRQLQFKPSQPSALRNVNSGDNEPIRIESRSPIVPNKVHQYQSFKCKWQGCKAELHNLDTLKKHVFKVHRASIDDHGFIECHWADCAREVTNQDVMTGTRLEQYKPKSFTTIANWMQHLEQVHFCPLSWELGDGPASGVSDATDSEAYLSDAHGRRVTPKLTARPEYLENSRVNTPDRTSAPEPLVPRGRGRPSKKDVEQKARDVQKRLVSQKKRVGGPGMDRGGATLANEKRRRGFISNDDVEEELVDVEV